jgi:hypothetical protein
MHFISKRAVVLGAFASLGFAGTAQAATDDTSVTLTGGTISITAPTFGDFPGATLAGLAQGEDATVSDWSVNDPRGNGFGWEVSMAASTLSTGGGSPIIMTGATLTVAAPEVAPTDPSNLSTDPAVFGGDIRAGTVKVADANANEGLGEWDFTQGATDLSIGIPADARAGSYTSTITTTLTPSLS